MTPEDLERYRESPGLVIKVALAEWKEETGIVRARGGKVRLLRREELPKEWDPERGGCRCGR